MNYPLAPRLFQPWSCCLMKACAYSKFFSSPLCATPMIVHGLQTEILVFWTETKSKLEHLLESWNWLLDDSEIISNRLENLKSFMFYRAFGAVIWRLRILRKSHLSHVKWNARKFESKQMKLIWTLIY